MIGIDTNILVRWITFDDPAQSRIIQALFKKHNSTGEIFISDTVLVELEWVLSSVYKFSRTQIAHALGLILLTRQFSFRNKTTLIGALSHYSKGARDFSDCLIGESGREMKVKTYTFDKQLKRNPNFIVTA